MNSRKTGGSADVDNRSRLLRAATDAFAEHGYEGASLRVIADNAGVSFQLIAYYFGSKEELWVATVDFLYERYLETGKSLGFTSSGNLAEQFRNHLRLLLTDALQRPQYRKISIQEYLADSPRYHHVILPKIKHLYEDLALPYFKEVVRLGIVERFTAEELGLLWSSITQNNIVFSHWIELLLGLPAGSPKSVERQVDLMFAILTERLDTPAESLDGDKELPVAAKLAAPAAGPTDTVVYAWKDSKQVAAEGARSKQFEIENLHLKQLVGSLSLEKKVLLERLAVLEASGRAEGGA
jgi:TetR/AcrR family transcriptional regulator